jgi:hypothetical protein
MSTDKIKDKEPGKGLVAYVTDDYRKEADAKDNEGRCKRAVKIRDHRGYGKPYADGVQNLLANWQFAPLPEEVRDMTVEYSGSEATVYGLTTEEAVMLAEWINKLGAAVYKSPREAANAVLDALDKIDKIIVDLLVGGALVPPPPLTKDEQWANDLGLLFGAIQNKPLPEAPANAPKCNCPVCREQFDAEADDMAAMNEVNAFAKVFDTVLDAVVRGVATPGCDCARCTKLRAEGKV